MLLRFPGLTRLLVRTLLPALTAWSPCCARAELIVEAIAPGEAGQFVITYRNTGSPAATCVAQSAADLAGGFALVAEARFSALGGQRWTATVPADTGVRRFYRIVGYEGQTPGGPVITAAPTGLTAAAGSAGSLNVAASGEGLHFQWAKDGVDLPGANGPTLLFETLGTADAGEYSVRVFNANGATTSVSVSVAIGTTPPPQITRQPEDRVGPPGSMVKFSVSVQGDPAPALQWFHDGVALAGETAAELTVDGVTAAKAGYYQVTATNPGGSVTSAAAALALPGEPDGRIAVDEFTGSPAGWLDAEPNPRSADGYLQFNGGIGNYSSRRFSAGSTDGEVWMLYTFRMETAPTSYYILSPGNTTGSVQMFNTGFDASVSPNGIHGGGRQTDIPATRTQTFLYRFTSTAQSTGYELWTGEGIGLGIDIGATPWVSDSVSQSPQGLDSYYRSSGSAAQRMLVERIAVGRTAASVLPGNLPPRIDRQPAAANVVGGGSHTLEVRVSGLPTPVYQWYRNGEPIAGATAATYAIDNAGSADAGDYQVVVSNALGTVSSALAKLGVTLAPGENGLKLVPWPKNVEVAAGAKLALPAGARIVATDPSLDAVAAALAGDIMATRGIQLPVASGAAKEGDIVLELDGSLAGENHTLAVDTRATVRGGSRASVALGVATLLQALSIENGGLALPRLTIDDTPDVPIRALALDVARRDHSLELLLQTVDLCHLYKVNYLHLHFNDDQAFTFPSASHPELNEQTRAEGRKVYTLAELNTLEAYAQARGVYIMPELEVPGHNALMLRANPGLFQITYPLTPPAQYLPSSSINIAKPAVREAVRALIAEMAAVFPSTPYLHLGCDEVDWAWSQYSPDFIAAAAGYGFNRPDPADNVHLLFSQFITQCRDYAAEAGKRAIVWENHAILPQPEIPAPTDVLVMPFDSYSPGSFPAAGLKLINAAWSPLYVVNSVAFGGEPASPPQRISKPVSAIYGWNRGVFGQYSGESVTYFSQTVATDPVVGAQLTTWEQDDEMEVASTRRRLAAMAERVWNEGLAGGYANFSSRLAATDALLDSLLSPVQVRYSGLHDEDDRIFSPAAGVTLTLGPGAAAGLTIRYTTDGSDVTHASPLYTGPFQVTADGFLNAGAFNAAGIRVGHAAREWHRREMPLEANLAAGKPVTASGGADAAKAVDLLQAEGWATGVMDAGTNGISLTVDLGSAQDVRRIALVFASRGVYQYQLAASVDAAAWTTLADTRPAGRAVSYAGNLHEFPVRQARYVRVTLYRNSANDGPLTLREIMVFGTP